MEASNATQRPQRAYHIYVEANPNPNSMKFVANDMLVPSGQSFDFPDVAQAEHAPLAQKLFNTFDFIERVFYMSNFVTVTKAEGTDWHEVQDRVRTFIKAELEGGTHMIIPKTVVEQSNVVTQEDNETVASIKNILEEYIKPAVESDGGAISFHSFENGIVKVLLQGSCSGCPSSTITLKAGIENLLKRMVPGVEGVEAEGV